jgi:diketogulonate reductase-like aldo/keto reductase
LPIFDGISRRTFLAQSAALAAATSLPMGALAKESIRTRAIPGTDEHLPVVGIGSPRIFIDLPPEGKELPKAVLQAMVDTGGTVFDTPAFFRPDVPAIGPILNEMGLQDDLFLIGKITVNGKQQGIDHLEKLVANLNKRPIDALLIHNMRNLDEHWQTLQQWKEEGKVRYIGVSLVSRPDLEPLEKFIKDKSPDMLMIGYSISQQGPAERILPLALDKGVAVIGAEAFKTLEDGAYFDVVRGKPLPEWASEFDFESWAQYSLKYILSNPALTCVVTETSSVKHIIDNVRAAYGRLPDQAMRKRMSDYLLSL